MFSYKEVSKSYDGLDVLKSVDLDIDHGEIVGLIGPSGSGKTTFARLLMTLEEPSGGEIFIDGQPLWHEKKKDSLVKASEKHLRKMRGNIGMVFQHFHLFPHMTVLKNVMEAPITVLDMPKKEAESLAKSILDKVGLLDRLDYYPANLSGGQKQRVAIARALVMSPKILIFDEPTSALDPELVGEVLDVIKDIAKEGETAMLLITHEMEFARDIADRIVFFDEGHIVEEGVPEEIFNNPKTPRLQSFLSRFNNGK